MARIKNKTFLSIPRSFAGSIVQIQYILSQVIQTEYHFEDNLTLWYQQNLKNATIYHNEIQNLTNEVQAGEMQYGFPI